MKYWQKWLLFVGAFVAPALVTLWIFHAASPAAFNAAYLVMFFVWLVLFIRFLIFGSPKLPWPETVGSAARWRASAVAAAFSWGVPAVSLIAATQGQSRSALIADFLGPGSQGIWGLPEGLCLWGIPFLVLVVPSWLHAVGREHRGDSPVPGWLAGAAAILTAASLVVLHFGGGALAGLQLGILSFAAFGAAVLLAPFYRAVANACWAGGVAAVLDPAQWWRAWCVAWAELRGVPGNDDAAGDLAAREEAICAPPGGIGSDAIAQTGGAANEPPPARLDSSS